MSTGAGAGAAAAGAAAAAAIAQAIKASGAIVRVDPDDFLKVIHRVKEPLVIHATGGFINKSHQYLSSYKGLAFFTKNPEALHIPSTSEVIEAEKIWIPG